MPEGQADTATETEAIDITPSDTPDTGDDATVAEIAALARELGITPGQLKGRLEASKKWEQRAKLNTDAAKELDALKQASMSDQEKAVNIARAEARTSALAEFGTKLVDAEVRAAAAGRPADVIDALLEGLDRARFLDTDGEPDRAAITAWVDRVAPVSQDAAGFPDLGQGSRTAASDDMGLGSDPLFQTLKRMTGVR